MENEVLKSAIKRILQVYEGEILPESTFENALGADSIDMAQIFTLVQDELGICISEKEWRKVNTVEDALELIRGKTSGE